MSTVAEGAYSSIRTKLIHGDLAPGQRVSQVRIARELGCSTVPVVEALRRLESDGLLTKEPRKMAKVRVLSATEVEGLYYVRQSLEMAAVRLCATRILREEIEQLQELNRQFEQLANQRNLKESDRLDMEIHHFIVRCARCPLLEQELDRLMLIDRTVPGRLLDPADWDRHALSHRAIVEAVANRDADSAEYLMKIHIQYGYDVALSRLGREDRKS